MVNQCFFLMSELSSLCCQVHWGTSEWTSREWDATSIWGVWDSSQVLTLTFEFSSRWPHHLMPLNCFSSSLFLHSYPSLLPPPPLSFPFSFLSLPLFPPCLPSSASIPTVSPLLYISPLAHSSPLDASLPSPLRPLSQVSDRPISAPMIAVGVLAWQLSRRWQELGSAWELILPLLLQPSLSHHHERQRGRQKERKTIAINPSPPSTSFTNLVPFLHQTITMTVWPSHFANCLPKTFNFRRRRPAADGWYRLAYAGICCNLVPWVQILDTRVLCICPSLPW